MTQRSPGVVVGSPPLAIFLHLADDLTAKGTNTMGQAIDTVAIYDKQ